VKPPETPAAIRTDILARFMRGDLTADGAARALKATFSGGAEKEYLIWPVGTWSGAVMRAKVAELAAAMDDAQFVTAAPGERDLPVRAFPFRAADFARRADVARRRSLRGLGPLLIVAAGGLLVPFLAPGGGARYLVPVLFTFIIVFSGVAFALGIRDQRQSRQQGLVCPSCGVALVGTKRFGGLVDTEVLRTGRCPQCHTQLLHPDEVRNLADR
jgi:hypothetical protein